MKEKKIEKLCYKETSILNEKGEITKTIGYDPAHTSFSGYNSTINTTVEINPYISTSTELNVSPYSGGGGNGSDHFSNFSKLYSPSNPESYNYSDYIGESLKREDEKQNRISRTEQMTIARMNTLKEVLDKINACESFDEVYKVISELKREYDKLSGEDGK